MTFVFVLAVMAVLGAAVFVAVGRFGELPEAEPDLRPEERDGAPSFDIVARGYRMDEVDAQLAAMQQEIDELRGQA
ncbi:MAG: hypothetical protein GC156_04830 [Actinomycetales bacterium]|nr:hypothetical protein [Actinomycetales bacterium]